jgi:hypothetical protein
MDTKLLAFVNSLHVLKYSGHVVILLWAIGVESDWHDRFSLLKRLVDIYLQTITSVYHAWNTPISNLRHDFNKTYGFKWLQKSSNYLTTRQHVSVFSSPSSTHALSSNLSSTILIKYLRSAATQRDYEHWKRAKSMNVKAHVPRHLSPRRVYNGFTDWSRHPISRLIAI